MFKNQSGFSKIKFVVVTTTLLVSGYLGWQAFYYHYCFWDLEELVKRQADKSAILSDGEIRDNILKKIRESNIPFDPEADQDDFTIERDGEKIYISLKYTEVVVFDFAGFYYEVKDYPFHVYAETEIAIK